MSLEKEVQTRLRPRGLAYIFGGLGIFLTVLLFYPISEVFRGNWKLNQFITIAQSVVLDFNAWGVVSITSALGLDPVIPIGDINIRYYAIFMIAGLLAGYCLAIYLARFHYIANTIIDRLVIGLVIFGLVGARLLFVLFEWEFYQELPLTIITEVNRGGLSIFGMMIFAAVYLWYYCRKYKFKVFEMLDIIAPAVLLGQIIGRWGNFFNYEAYGPETSVFWKMFVPDQAIYYEEFFNARYFHPTFLYEIIPNFILLFFILFYYENLTAKHSGRVFALYAMGYGLIRTFTEFFRLDALTWSIPEQFVLNFNDIFVLDTILVSQVLAFSLFVYGVVVWFNQGKYLFIKKNLEEMRIF